MRKLIIVVVIISAIILGALVVILILIIFSIEHKLKEHTVLLCHNVKNKSAHKQQCRYNEHSYAGKKRGETVYITRFNIINEKDAHTVLENGETGSRLLHNLSRPPIAFKGVFSNIGQQLAYLWDSYTPVENVTQFIEDLSEFLSGG